MDQKSCTMRRIINIGILITVIVLGNNTAVNAQYVLKEADQQFNLYNYVKAVTLYTSAYEKKKTLHSVERLAESYRLMRDFKQAEEWYATLVNMEGAKPEAVKWYATMLQNNSKYAEAKTQYIKYGTLLKEVNNIFLNNSILSCDSALKWIKNPAQVNVINEQALNSKQSDWGLVKYGSNLIFSSDRVTQLDNNKISKPFLKFDGDKLPDRDRYGWTGNDYLHLYQATPNDLSVFPLPTGDDYHISSATFNGNGNELFYAVTRMPKNTTNKDKVKTINVEIYSSSKQQENWSTPVPFRYNNIEKWSVGDPFLSKDGNTLYFVSNQPGGKGGTDIYSCKRNADDTWGDAVNLMGINTTGNERTPNVSEDGSIYFSSDGYIGMGGLDIFKAKLGINQGSAVQNLGYPINSSQDDFAFNVVNKLSGYFSSNRVGGLGSDDIYSFVIKEKPIEQVIEKPIYSLSGRAMNKETNAPLQNVLVSLTQADGANVNVRTDGSGNFEFKLKENIDYNLAAEKDSFIKATAQVTTKGLLKSSNLRKDLYLAQIVIGKAIRMDNILYDFNKADIRPDAAVELDKLVTTLKENPTIWIELGSHTDSRGNDAYNLKLSQSRANSAVNYIVSKGIAKERITAKGYGETKLINKCANGIACTEEAHQLNRRTEFKIVKQ